MGNRKLDAHGAKHSPRSGHYVKCYASKLRGSILSIFQMFDHFLRMDSVRVINFPEASTAAKDSVQKSSPYLSPGPRNLGAELGSCTSMEAKIIRLTSDAIVIQNPYSDVEFCFSVSNNVNSYSGDIRK